MASNIEIIIGTYEQFLLGYKVEQVSFCELNGNSYSTHARKLLFSQDGDKHSLHQSFAVHSHIASIRSVHASKRYLASGGSDDRIYVYDMKSRQEIQVNIRNIQLFYSFFYLKYKFTCFSYCPHTKA